MHPVNRFPKLILFSAGMFLFAAALFIYAAYSSPEPLRFTQILAPVLFIIAAILQLFSYHKKRRA